jgi:hypothetical protein
MSDLKKIGVLYLTYREAKTIVSFPNFLWFFFSPPLRLAVQLRTPTTFLKKVKSTFADPGGRAV